MNIHERLANPFDPSEVRWRVGNLAKNGNSATLLAYIDSRTVMDRLDDIVGPARWRDTYRPGAAGGLICRIEIYLELPDDTWAWVGKEDAAENTQVEAVKGGISDAFKRAAVKWGIGRYLYHIPTKFYRINKPGYAPDGKGINVSQPRQGVIGWIPTPKLSKGALPRLEEEPEQAPVMPEEPKVPEGAAGVIPQRWDDNERKRFCGDLTRIGWKYDDVAAFCEHLKRPRPSNMTPKQRADLFTYVKDGPVALLDFVESRGA